MDDQLKGGSLSDYLSTYCPDGEWLDPLPCWLTFTLIPDPCLLPLSEMIWFTFTKSTGENFTLPVCKEVAPLVNHIVFEDQEPRRRPSLN
jgi:hypothetical protein